jgi:hypothetical protein
MTIIVLKFPILQLFQPIYFLTSYLSATVGLLLKTSSIKIIILNSRFHRYFIFRYVTSIYDGVLSS